jgi:transposase-like protein
VWVFGMVEKTPERRIICVSVHKRDGETLLSIIKKYVHPDSIIYSDKWGGYINLTELGYAHFSVNHSNYFVDPVTKVHTNTIEGNWSGLRPRKRRTKKYIVLDLLIIMLERNNYGDSFEYLLKLL